MDELGLQIEGDYDLNDIESRLYSQVFHGTAEDESESNSFNTCDNSTPVTGKRQSYRYFGSRVTLDARPQLQITIDNSNQAATCSSLHHNLTILTPSNEIIKFSGGYENTVNQYTIPVLVNTNNVTNDWNIVDSNYESLENLQPLNIENSDTYNSSSQILTRRQKNQIRNKRRRENRRLKLMQSVKNLGQEPNKKIIFISDDSEDESVLFNESLTMTSNKIDNKKPDNAATDSDDDIIYVPPSPVQVINIDEEDILNENVEPPVNESYVETGKSVSSDSEEAGENLLNENLSCSATQETSNNVESTSNDFLDNTSENSATRFNFALHGSDFSNNGEVTRPNASLVDFCETESSCSTNDHNKDFNNSAKSIVFNEVEFPKEDIFAGKNLDSFSSFITPRRSDKNVINNITSVKKKNSNSLINTESSASSTESDYESDARSSNKNLPTLSPMVTSETLSKTTPKLNKKKLKESTDSPSFKKSINKKKSSRIDSLGNSNTKLPKKKKKLSKDFEATNDSVDQCELSEVQIPEQEEVDNSKKRKKKKSHNFSGKTNESQDLMDSVNDEYNPNLIINSCCESAGEQDQAKKKKRKKKKSKKSVDIDEDKTEDNVYTLSKDVLSVNSLEDSMISEGVHGESLTANEEYIDNVQNIDIIGEDNINRWDRINDPNDINLYDELIEVQTEDINVQHDEAKEDDDDDVIVVDQTENRLADGEVILVDDMSDSSDVELIEYVDLSNLELGNCNKSIDVSNLNLDDESIDYFNSFDVKAIQNKQSDDPQKWLVSYKDRATYFMVGKKGPRCTRCRHFGHIGSKCPEKPNPPCCSLCSASNHQEPRCPNKVCRQCGNPGDYSTSYCYLCFKYRHIKCNLCNVPGHISKACPDQWRRYHLTTEAGPIIMPNQQVMRPRNQQWCSGCARQGHLEHECNDTYYHREYPPTRPDIVTYIDVLNENDVQRDISYIPESVPEPTTPNNIPVYSFPIMNNLLTINANPISPFGRTVAPNSLNSNIIIQVPNSCVQQNVLTPNLMDQMRSNFQNPNVNNLSTNIIEQMSHNFQNPILTAKETTTNSTDLSKFDMKKVQELFMTMPLRIVKNFVKKQIEELDTKIVNYSPKLLRHKLFKYDRSENPSEKCKRERLFWSRVLNMFIFGIHHLNDGKSHIKFIRSFLLNQKTIDFDETIRRSLYKSYAYIFGVDKHTNTNYYRLTKLLVDRCNEREKEGKPL